MKRIRANSKRRTNEQTQGARTGERAGEPHVGVGATLYREGRGGEPNWMPEVITGETKGTWRIRGAEWNAEGINKKTMCTPRDRQGYRDRYYTAAARDAKEFADAHARAIAGHVSVCTDAEKLRAIAVIIGYDTTRSK